MKEMKENPAKLVLVSPFTEGVSVLFYFWTDSKAFYAACDQAVAKGDCYPGDQHFYTKGPGPRLAEYAFHWLNVAWEEGRVDADKLEELKIAITHQYVYLKRWLDELEEALDCTSGAESLAREAHTAYLAHALMEAYQAGLMKGIQAGAESVAEAINEQMKALVGE